MNNDPKPVLPHCPVCKSTSLQNDEGTLQCQSCGHRWKLEGEELLELLGFYTLWHAFGKNKEQMKIGPVADFEEFFTKNMALVNLYELPDLPKERDTTRTTLELFRNKGLLFDTVPFPWEMTSLCTNCGYRGSAAVCWEGNDVYSHDACPVCKSKNLSTVRKEPEDYEP